MRARTPGNHGPDSCPDNTERTTLGWIGVDLDGTLAKSVKAQTGEEIGVPIPPMVQRVRVWLSRGEDVRIFTARVNPNRGQANAMRARMAIEAWCKRHLGQVLPITYEKDWDMTLLFDDRARQVERDTGRLFCRLRKLGLHAGENTSLWTSDKAVFHVARETVLPKAICRSRPLAGANTGWFGVSR